MRNQTGQVVRKDDFFLRDKEVRKLWRKIENGNNILLSAPRRTGKTSLLRYLEDNPKDGFVFLYVLVQSKNNAHEYYQKIIESLHSPEFIGPLERAGKAAGKLFHQLTSHVEGIEAFDIGLTLKDPNYKATHQDLEKVLKNLKLEKKLVIVIDEYPDVLNSILEREGKEGAIQLLKENRSLSQNSEINDKVQFIYTGSVGLENFVQKISASNLINNLTTATLQPMKKKEATLMVEALLAEDMVEFQLNPKEIPYFLEQVEWLVPYYLQLLFASLSDLCLDEDIEVVETTHIDQAFADLFSHHNRTNYAHWQERLDKFELIERKFVEECLTHICNSDQGQLKDAELINISNKPEYSGKINATYMLNCLISDGYIHQDPKGEKVYFFNSPILKEWWRRYVIG